ncbi:MAG: cysteine synthase family protein [Oscillospiraceae bacterium]|nr:cysteine synthase family protein [Oscillospiraceae bacterium]
MICDSILDAIGSTPLVRLNRLTGPDCARILVKFEALNVGGSVKTRTAYGMILDAEKRGVLRPDSVIVEPTSGNQGVGLALTAAVRGYEAVIIMPDSVSPERRKLVELYGARVVLVHDAGNIGEAIDECLRTALRMQEEDPRVWIPQQFVNPANPEIQRRTTAREILEQAEGLRIDGFCSGIGTGGTLSGIGEVLREANPDIVIWAVEPESAAILSGGSIGSHLQMGIGDGLIPANLNTRVYNDTYVVKDEDAIAAAKALARKEGLACGITGGSNMVAALALAKKLGPGKTVVTLLPDTAERYYSTPLFD